MGCSFHKFTPTHLQPFRLLRDNKTGWGFYNNRLLLRITAVFSLCLFFKPPYTWWAFGLSRLWLFGQQSSGMRHYANWHGRTVVCSTLIMQTAVSFELLVHIHQNKQLHFLSPDTSFITVRELNSTSKRLHGSPTHKHARNFVPRAEHEKHHSL